MTDHTVQQAGHLLGVLMQNLWASFNPHVLLAGGPSCVRHPAMVQAARQTLLAYSELAGLPAPAIRTAHYGLLAVSVGASALVLHQYLRPMHRRVSFSGAPSQRKPAVSKASLIASEQVQ